MRDDGTFDMDDVAMSIDRIASALFRDPGEGTESVTDALYAIANAISEFGGVLAAFPAFDLIKAVEERS